MPRTATHSAMVEHTVEHANLAAERSGLAPGSVRHRALYESFSITTSSRSGFHTTSKVGSSEIPQFGLLSYAVTTRWILRSPNSLRAIRMS